MQLIAFLQTSSLHYTYSKYLMKELIFLMWPVKQEHNTLYVSIKTDD